MSVVKIPKGWYIVRNRTRIHKGDRFKKQNGHWSKTSDAGRKVCRGEIPYYEEHPQYAGIYIRRTRKQKTRK